MCVRGARPWQLYYLTLCGWRVRFSGMNRVSENLEDLKRFVPRSYPRHLEQEEESIVTTVAVVFGALGLAATLLTTAITYNQRKRLVFVFAQVEFVFLLLFGLMLVSTGAVLTALPPTNLRCVSTAWLINIGYSFELVPLVVKIFAINSLMQAAKRMKRIQLGRKLLFGVVAALTMVVIIYMVLWSIFDPPSRIGNYHLTELQDEDGSTVVSVAYYCQSKSGFWMMVSVGAQALLLLCASVLSFMTRRMQRKDVNETNTISFLIYWNFVCVLLRGILLLLGDTVDVGRVNRSLSMILSADSIATILIYFVPKFLTRDEPTGADFAPEVWQPRGSRDSTTASILAARGSVVAEGRPSILKESSYSRGGGATKRLSSIKDALSSGKDLGSSGLGKSDIDGSAGGNGNSRTAESDEPGDDSESKPDSERLKTWGLSEQ